MLITDQRRAGSLRTTPKVDNKLKNISMQGKFQPHEKKKSGITQEEQMRNIRLKAR